MVVVGIWMVFVKFFVGVLEGAMIGAVLSSAIETLLVSEGVSFADIPMILIMLLVILGVGIIVIVCERRGDG